VLPDVAYFPPSGLFSNQWLIFVKNMAEFQKNYLATLVLLAAFKIVLAVFSIL